jgi:protein-tyrosine kinase
MSRVNEALSRAAGREPSAPGEEIAGSGLALEDVAAEAWTSESGAMGGAPGTLEDDQPAVAHTWPALTAGWPGPGAAGASKLVMGDDVSASSVEQYRRLAARLYLSQAERGTSAVMVTSAVMEEGKTLTATNLALTLSESYKKRVLLIDADLRRPGVHELFGLPNVTGLNDGQAPDVERKVPLISVTENLSVLTAGRPESDPMSVLASNRMQRILRDAAAAFDWVIVDTPPVAVLSDAHLLASLVDTVVLIVRAGTTPLASIKAAADAVGRDRIFGVVLNRVEAPAASHAYNRYTPAVRGVAAGT